jgi:hypothetical protein
MAEERRVIETKVPREEAYTKCFKRASLLGLNMTVNIRGQQLEVGENRRGAGYWTLVVLGLIFYVIPGVLMLVYWRPVYYCKLTFEDAAEGCTIIATLKGTRGRQFFQEVAALLIRRRTARGLEPGAPFPVNVQSTPPP